MSTQAAGSDSPPSQIEYGISKGRQPRREFQRREDLKGTYDPYSGEKGTITPEQREMLGKQDAEWRMSDEERFERKKLESKLKTDKTLTEKEHVRLGELRAKRQAIAKAGEQAKQKYLNGERWHDEVERANSLSSNMGNQRDPNGELSEEDEDSGKEVLEGFHFEGPRSEDNRGVVKESVIAEDSNHLINWTDLMVRWNNLGLPIEEFPKKQDRGGRDALFEANKVLKRIRKIEIKSEDTEVAGDHYDGYEYYGQDEDTKTVDPETLTETINITLNPGFIMQENAIGYLQGKLTPQDLEEIWNTTNEVVIKLDKNGDPKIGIKSANGKGLNLSLEDFFKMTRTEIDGKSYGLETPEIDMTDQEEPEKRYLDIRPIENLLNRLNVNGQPLGGQTPPTYRYLRDAN